MKVTVITVCYNSAVTIKETVESVIAQSHPDIEYIIIDGLSSDGTQDIVAKYGNAVSTFVSEKDSGIYDAMNKGIQLATGELIGILNSDDLYVDNYVVANVVEMYKKHETPIIYGDIILVGREDTNQITRKWVAGKFSFLKVRHQFWVPPHPAFFTTRNVYNQIGNFNTAYPLTADADFMLRALYIHKLPYHYINRVQVKMRAGGATGQGIKAQKALIKEYYRVAANLKISIYFYAIPVRLFLKALQVVKAKFGF